MSGFLHVNPDGSLTAVTEHGVITARPEPTDLDAFRATLKPGVTSFNFEPWPENDETPGPIPQGDRAGRASAPGEGARSGCVCEPGCEWHHPITGHCGGCGCLTCSPER